MRTHRHVDARMVNIVIMKSIRFDSNRIRPCRFIEKLYLATYWFWYNTTLFTMFTSINVSTNVILPSAHLARVANMPLDYLDEEQAEAWFSWIFNFKDLKVLKHPTYLMFNDVHQYHFYTQMIGRYLLNLLHVGEVSVSVLISQGEPPSKF